METVEISFKCIIFSFFIVFSGFLNKPVNALIQKQIVFRQFNVSGDPRLALATSLFNDKKELNINVTIMKEIPADEIFIQSKVFIKNAAGNSYAPILPGRIVNLCKVIDNQKVDPFLHKFIQNFSQHSNLFKSCPLRLGFYTLHNFTFDISLLPNFLPLGSYKANIWFFYKPANSTISTPFVTLTALLDLIKIK